MKWINQPRRIIIRDIIVSSLDAGIKKLEDIARTHQLGYEKPLEAWELQKQAEYLEKRGMIKHCPLTRVFMRTCKPYKFCYQI